jgi:hypothetical protein
MRLRLTGIFFVLLTLLSIGVVSVPKAQAQAAAGDTALDEIKQGIEASKKFDDGTEVSIDGLSWRIFNNYLTFFAYKTGGSPGGVAPASSGGTTDASPGLIQNMTSGIAMLYTPQASTHEYVADLMNSAGIATPAYAQGLGFSALSPVLETWKVFRNIAYFFYVLVFLAVGFMIMFRRKIGSQTVVTVQQALPNIIVSLLAVTFSYAIAGLMIDLMYLTMYFLVGVFSTNPSLDLVKGDIDRFGLTSNVFDIGKIILDGGALGTVNQSVGSMVNGVLGIQEGGLGPLSAIAGLAAVVVFGIALLFSIFRLFFELLKTYVDIVLSVVTAPLTLMMGALPGSKAFGGWVKRLFFSLLVFPAVLVIVIIALLLQRNISRNGGFLPPYLGGIGSSGSVGPLLGLGIVLIIPDIVEKIKKMGGSSWFDQFANSMGSAVKRGFTGGELIPGVALTDTRKLPFGGLSGENIFRKAGIGAGAVAGAGYGAAWEGPRLRARGDLSVDSYSQARSAGGRAAKWVGGKLGDKQINDSKKDSKGGGH